MLKDAPIVIFDEATANVDPENEDRLQAAIEALTKDKTVIIVLNKGQIVQQGTHEQLMEQGGIYSDFIGRRKQAIGWKI